MSDIGFGFVNSLHNTAGGRQWLSSSCFRLSLRLRPAGWSQASRQIHDDDDRAFVGAERRRIGMPRLAAGGSSTTDADTDRPTAGREPAAGLSPNSPHLTDSAPLTLCRPHAAGPLGPVMGVRPSALPPLYSVQNSVLCGGGGLPGPSPGRARPPALPRAALSARFAAAADAAWRRRGTDATCLFMTGRPGPPTTPTRLSGRCRGGVIGRGRRVAVEADGRRRALHLIS